jgi:hypothetical protein
LAEVGLAVSEERKQSNTREKERKRGEVIDSTHMKFV